MKLDNLKSKPAGLVGILSKDVAVVSMVKQAWNGAVMVMRKKESN